MVRVIVKAIRRVRVRARIRARAANCESFGSSPVLLAFAELSTSKLKEAYCLC